MTWYDWIFWAIGFGVVTAIIGVVVLTLVRGHLELIDYLRWVRYVCGPKTANLRALLTHGLDRWRHFAVGRNFTSISMGRNEWRGIGAWYCNNRPLKDQRAKESKECKE